MNFETSSLASTRCRDTDPRPPSQLVWRAMLVSERKAATHHSGHEERGPVPEHGLGRLGFLQPWKRIFSCPLTQLAGKCLDITPYATPCRYRLLSLHNLRLFGDVEIFEFEELSEPDEPYIPGFTTVSYVWRGLDADNDLPSSQRANSRGDFIVKGEENANPISISVIEDIAWATLRRSASSGCGPDRFLWLDQLCIMQTSKEDKAWQISRMYTIYFRSRCLVLLGGLTRLASLDDTTHWISRAWTLQEVLAPSVVLNQDVDTSVLFINDPQTQKAVEGIDDNEWGDTPYLIDEIIACAPLLPLFDTLRPLGRSMFGFRDEQLETLVDAMNITLDSHKTLIWRSAFSRTSSRPVDMIFSIMQCFKVMLDPKKFEKNDRIAATIALVQAILKNPSGAGRAYWIPALYFLPPAPELSIFPRFPETRVDGDAAIRMPDGSIIDTVGLLTNQATVKLQRTSHVARSFEFDGSEAMDDQGYYSFVARQIYTLNNVSDNQNDNHRSFCAGDGSTWVIIGDYGPDPCTELQSEAVYWGEGEHLPHANDIEGDVLAVFIGDEGDKYVYMLVKKHGPRKYHRFTHLFIDRESLPEWSTARYSVRISIGPFPASV